jgi:NADH-quinone oxidoreductase subunit L
MYLLIIFLPFLSFITAAFFGRFIGRNSSTILTTGSIFLTAILSTIAFYEVAIAEANCYIQIGT